MRQQFKVLTGRRRRPGQRLQEVALFDDDGAILTLGSKNRNEISYDDEQYYDHEGVLLASLNVGDAIGRYRVWRPEAWVAAEEHNNIEIHMFVRGTDPWADYILGFNGQNAGDTPNAAGLLGASDDTGLDLLVLEEPVEIAYILMSNGDFVDDPEARPTAGLTIIETEIIRV